MKHRLLIPLLALSLLGCEETPTGRSRLALVPDAMMTDMGAQAFAHMKQQQPLSDDPDARALVACVTDAILSAVPKVYPASPQPEDWEVVVFDDPAPNAFALPGGHIGVHSGMLRVAESPDQLAAIVGHEVGHLLAEHGNERMTNDLGIQVGLMLVGLFGDMENAQLLHMLGLGAQVGIALPFSRAHESEADSMGLRLMAAAGFRPEESVALWRNMAAAGSKQPIEFLSTHPAHETRIQQLQAGLPAVRQRFAQTHPPDCG